MPTPQEKAKELVKKYYPAAAGMSDSVITDSAKYCAIICVNEILNELDQLHKPEYTTFITDYEKPETIDGFEKRGYWEEVKEAITLIAI